MSPGLRGYVAPGYVAITKSGNWQGRREEWTNVYWLDDFPTVSAADGQAAIESIMALERAVHAPSVRFDRAVVYRKGGLAGLEGIRLMEFSNTFGQASGTAAIYRESAVLVKFRLPRSGIGGLGRFRQLMKWLHVYELASPTTNEPYGDQAFDASTSNFYMTNFATPLLNNSHGPGRLSNEDGVRPLAAEIHPYLEHRQFHQGRKES